MIKTITFFLTCYILFIWTKSTSVLSKNQNEASYKHNSLNNSDFNNNENRIGYPVQLVMPDQTHTGFKLNPEGINILKNLKSPISIITAVGTIHTGKSYLLNQILGYNSGFEIGYTVDPGTTGIWMWSEPIFLKNDKVKKILGSDSLSVILIDTEGFHGPNVTKSYDQTLYAIASLISTEVLFVSIRMMDNRDLEYLEELTKGANLFALRAYSKSIAKALETKLGNEIKRNPFDISHIIQGENTKTEDSNSIFDNADSAAIIDSLNPSTLTWVVQDFIQDLEGMTPIDWLNNLIDTTPRSSPRNISYHNDYNDEYSEYDKEDKKQVLSHSLREMYETIDCVTFTAPSSYNKLRYIDELSNEDLTEEFKEEIHSFRIRLFERAIKNVKSISKISSSNQKGINSCNQVEPSSINKSFHSSTWVSGPDLADLLKFLVTAANENYFDDIDVFINRFLKFRADVIKNDLKQLYESAMLSFLKNYPPPLLEEVKSYELELYNRTLALWNQHLLGDHDKDWTKSAHQSLIELLRSGVENYSKTAETLIKNYCHKHVEQQLQKEELLISEKYKSLPLPKHVLENWLTNQASKSKNILHKSINQDGKNYINTSVCKEELRVFYNQCEEKHIKIKSENNDTIYARYLSGRKASVKKLYELLNDRQNVLVFQTEIEKFEKKLFEWKLIALNEFNSVVGDLLFMEIETSEAKQKLENDLKEPLNEAKKMWDEQCNLHCHEFSESWQKSFRFKVLSEISLPIEEEILQSHIMKNTDEAIKEFSEIYCSHSPIWENNFNRFDKLMQKLGIELDNENIEAMKIYFKEPLNDVTEKLQIEATHFSLWKSFSELAVSKARTAILNNIELNATHLAISPSLIEKVINNWMHDDLYKIYFPIIAKNFHEIIWKIGGGTSIFIGLITILWFKNKFFGLLFLIAGLYGLLGLKVISELLRSAFQGSVKYFFNILTQFFGFEIACLIVITIISAIPIFYKFTIKPSEKQQIHSQDSVYPTNDWQRVHNPSNYLLHSPHIHHNHSYH